MTTATIEQDIRRPADEEVPIPASSGAYTVDERLSAIERSVINMHVRNIERNRSISDLDSRMEVAEDELVAHVDAIERLTDRPTMLVNTGTGSSDNTHIRIQTTKNTKGYGFETVVSVDGADSDDVSAQVRQLLAAANDMARAECARLEYLDANPGFAADAAVDLNEGWKE